MLESSQIRNGLLDSSTLTNSEFFCDLPRDPEERNQKKDRWGQGAMDSSEGEVMDDTDTGNAMKVSLTKRSSNILITDTSAKPKRLKKFDNADDSAEGRVQLLSKSPVPDTKFKTNDRGLMGTPSAMCGQEHPSDRLPEKIQTSLNKIKSTVVTVGGPSCPTCCPCGPRTRIILVVATLLLLVTLSVIILCLAFTVNRPKPIAVQVTEVSPWPTSYSIKAVTQPTVQIPQRVCFNSSCLRVASVIAERLEVFNSPEGFAQSRGNCAPSDLLYLTKILAYGDRPGFFVGQNSVGMMQKRLLHSIWSSVSEALQNITPSRYVPMWIKKLSFLYRILLTRGISIGGVAAKPSSELATREQSSANSVYSKQPNGNNITAIVESSSNSVNDYLTLDDLLQRGNIAFHGLGKSLL